jgi:DNA polymerase-3 subunit gamma/tau
VVGQEHVTKTLAGALASGRLAHAFCFTGPRGVGKTSVARILAKSLNCENGPTAEPCGSCARCQEIDQARAVDVQEIDAASNSRVEDVRELREMIRYRPQAARFRVTILDEVHMLSKAAFNALLKTLEEPPEHAVFILATTDVHKVPLTILSRCQRYDFRRLAPRALAAHLQEVLASEGCRLAKESVALMAREADGSVRDALSLLDQVLSMGREELGHAEVVELLGLVDRELVARTAAAVLARDPAACLELVEQVYAAGGEMQAFYGALQEEFRNLAAAKAAPEGADLFGLSAEEVAELRARAGEVSPETLHEVFHHLAQSEELFRRAGQPRLVMEMTLLKLTQVPPVLSLEEVIAGLGGEGQAGPAPAAGGGRAAAAGGSAAAAPASRVAEPPPEPESPPAPAPAPRAAEPEPPPAPAPEKPAGGQPEPGAAMKALADQAGKAGEMILATRLAQATARREDGCLVAELAGPGAQLCTEENCRRLTGLARELWGPGVSVRLRAARAEPEAPAAPEREKNLEAVASLAEHPAVQEAAEVFEAQVVALNPAPE